VTAPAALARPYEGVVVGASAGGVEALSRLLPALPARCPASVFVVLHLPRERPSLLVEVFQPHCVLPVREAQDKEPAAPGTVYVAPPDYHLLVDEGPQIALSTDELVHFSRPSIDVLFESAADVYGPRLLGIVLTGGNADGADGLDAIRRAGGITAVQDPAQAFAPYMIEAALRKGPARHVLPLAGVADLLRSVAAPGGRP
jgi:two-component system chemotaxis response regulator CheB